jgi:cytoskeleton protein RodZ
MSDGPDTQPSMPNAATAGSLLRQARQAQGLHIAALATAIKVTPRKLELLEADRLDELPDATFTRALAQTVCRTLKIDSAPVLALLPPPKGHRLEQVSEGLNAPFREHPGRLDATDWAALMRPAVLAPVLVLLATAAVYLVPSGMMNWPQWSMANWTMPGMPSASVSPTTAAAPAASAVVAAGAAAPVAAATPTDAAPPAAPAMVETVHSVPQEAVPAASAADAAPAVAGALQLRTTAESWVEVLDGRWQPLLSRMVQPGETVGLDGAKPFRIKIGNAAVTQVTFKGQPVELAGFTRDNVAKLELK